MSEVTVNDYFQLLSKEHTVEGSERKLLFGYYASGYPLSNHDSSHSVHQSTVPGKHLCLIILGAICTHGSLYMPTHPINESIRALHKGQQMLKTTLARSW